MGDIHGVHDIETYDSKRARALQTSIYLLGRHRDATGRVKYRYKKETRTLKPSFSWFEPAYSSRFDAHGLIFKKCRETLM